MIYMNWVYSSIAIALHILTFFQFTYPEEYEQQRGKGSFPAMITPAYQIAKRANELASDVSSTSHE